ncbi:MAG: efflux RND transporter periplasmic adaptor subunit [Planctomycetaceae bacterium]|nr:efflux RND transporter periplasmic adaptor subunit [Planctomycetaceae bacterium]
MKLPHAFIILVLVGLIAGSVYVIRGSVSERFLPQDIAEHNHDHDHDHDHAHDHDHSETASAIQGLSVEIALSPTAAKNIGLDDSAIITVEAIDYYKSFSFPGVVVERPGFSTIIIPSPVSGVVTRIHYETGVAVEPGEPLFDILLNQQELVKTQTEFLTLLRKREINTAELGRLAGLDPQIVPKQRRELEYEKFQIDSEIEIQRNILRLQGLNESDIAESLEKTGTIIRTMTVYAPPFENEEHIASAAHADEEEHIFTVDDLFVSAGKNVAIGDSLCQLTDYCKLAIKGKVFAVNEKALSKALASKSRMTATFEGNGSRETVEGLVLRSIDNKIDLSSGAVFCYVDLKNNFTNYEVRDESNPRRYIQWHFKPGQRCELNVEVEPLPNCMVLPVGAVAKDFQEMYVFEWSGDEEDSRIWRKKPVHVIYQTKDHAVIANDGSLLPGTKIAAKGAGFILAALEAASQKNTGGGGIQHGDHVH